MTQLTATGLAEIASGYALREKWEPSQRAEAFQSLYERYVQGRIKPLAEALSCGAAVSAWATTQDFDPGKLDPQQLEAFQLAFPNLDPGSVADYSGEALDGLLTAWKGKLFEVKVRDALNEGQWVADLHLEPGQRAELAESVTQPGWDLQMLEADGTVAEQVQLKATHLVSYVESAADRYPGIPIITTSEVGHANSPHTAIEASHLSDQELDGQLADVVAPELVDSVWDVVLPAVPLALNLYWVARGDRSVEQATKALVASAGAMAVGAGAASLSGDLITDVVFDAFLAGGLTFLLRWAFGSSTKSDKSKQVPAFEPDIDRSALVDRLGSASDRIRRLGRRYPGPTDSSISSA